MTDDTEPRGIQRRYTTADVILMFAAQGTAIDVMSRALLVSKDQVRGVCDRARESGALVGIPPETHDDRKHALTVEVSNLRQKLDDLRALLKEAKAGKRSDLMPFIGLAKATVSEAKILCALFNSPTGSVSKQMVYNDLYGHLVGSDQPEPKIIDVLVCKVRKKLEPHEITIRTLWGFGYEMDEASRAKLLTLANVPRIASPSLAPETVPA